MLITYITHWNRDILADDAELNMFLHMTFNMHALVLAAAEYCWVAVEHLCLPDDSLWVLFSIDRRLMSTDRRLLSIDLQPLSIDGRRLSICGRLSAEGWRPSIAGWRVSVDGLWLSIDRLRLVGYG